MTSIPNQNPEQIARDLIDKQLMLAGWLVQSKNEVNLSAGRGIAVREYQTSSGPADYVLFVDRKPVGIIEAKREEEGERLTVAEDQSRDYATSKLKYLNHGDLPFVYESTGTLTKFTDYRDPKPRSRPVFHFHKPETFAEWLDQAKTLRARLRDFTTLDEYGLRPAQIRAIRNLETSFKDNRPKALIQMATGAGKTFTACTFIYRLLKFANAKRILFLVDTKNLGEQAEQEFLKYQPNDDNRKFTELYNVQRLSSSYIASDAQVCISTIQRLYAILQGKELEDTAEEENPNESSWTYSKLLSGKDPLPVAYNAKNPIEQFDFIIIDECHRSIYNLWKQVLDYYDAFLVGLTATPDKRTFGFFNQNVVSEYTYEESVLDGVNVPYDVFTIETEITKSGSIIKAKEFVDRREKLTRKKRWEQLEEDLEYKPSQLDRNIVNPSQIRTVIKAFREALPSIFPDRFDEEGEFEVPKTLIFAKTDSHADDIIQIVREEFNEGNDFCKKITYKIEEDPKSVLNRFRNSWAPRIAVTVDMIATGTDVKPLEVLLFMRDVKSTNYFEQMKGRGTRTIKFDDLQKVTRTAKHTKTHFVIVDAIGAIKSKKTDSRPLERKPSIPLKDLLGAVKMGAQDEDLFLSLANRLLRLEKELTEPEKEKFSDLAEGKSLQTVIKDLLNAYNPDVIEDIEAEVSKEMIGQAPDDISKTIQGKVEDLRTEAAKIFTGPLTEYVEKVRKAHDQVIDHVNIDRVIKSEWDTFSKDKANEVVKEFAEYIETHKDEILALSIFYDQPYKRRELNLKMIKELLEQLKLDRPLLAPSYVWEAYQQLDQVKENSPKNELIALVSLVRKVAGIDAQLTPYDKTVNLNFQKWIFKQNAGQHNRFSEEQVEWLRMIKDHIASSFQIDIEDLDYTPFDGKGGRGMMWNLFETQMVDVIEELNKELTA
ncbi:helicase, type I site-specific restriction-modification system restriction subunit [Belliella baltica DSM 15883]|uniref:Helicase, type I site-specific restriction-modification system restriction subunit n=1 Tax=Belliella baltica (strain DSM 15883 / CIP 108006 / LMG 21964 / BA134) TaxID=866536 RepID=I3Z6K3_BELBD|nr:DEAD/DEAH box helicase family protein [Belliella baltica]AFL84871.1 helicase, type I site-specific restriction-modification system restriction subunit [Belliella baltica DSM 15883]